jgi:hypothetical protein
MSQPSYIASGTTPLATDTKLQLWQKILGAQQNILGANAKSRNNPAKTDTIRRTLVKFLLALGESAAPSVNDPDVQRFLNTTSITTPTIITALNNLVLCLKSNGLWTSFDAIYPFVGGTSATCAVNLINPSNYLITWHGGMNFTGAGINSDGSTGYGDTGFNPNSAPSPHYQLNSGSLGVYCQGVTSGLVLFGCLSDGFYLNNDAMILQGGVVGLNATQINSMICSSNGNYAATVNGVTSRDLYTPCGNKHDGAPHISTGLPNFDFLFFRGQSGESTSFGSGPLGFAYIASAFTSIQISLLNECITTFETALERP